MSDDIWSRYGSQLPIGASSRDVMVGQTEWGAPIYQSPMGAQYWEPVQKEQPRESVSRAIAKALMDDPVDALGSGLKAVAGGIGGALSAPYRAWMGEPVTNADAFGSAGLAQVAPLGFSAPRGAIMSGLGRKDSWFPYSDFLDSPPAPTTEQMRAMGRLESVPVGSLRATNRSQWDRFSSGDHPPPLVQGYADRPVAVRMNNGEYLIYDGHHRSALSARDGVDAIDMDVINAQDYAPYAAGKSRKPEEGFNSGDDELLRLLMGE